jgi:pimeloyl-ACP methyl ester carboxylesterase/DNA-binding CsgD family transcriptional regulator
VPSEPGLEQEIRFCAVGEARVAYATVGSGPALLLPAALGASHLELEWGFPGFRGFVGKLAAGRTVVRYDRLGTGLSDRGPGIAELGLDAGLRTLEAVVAAIGTSELSLLGFSAGGATSVAFAARHPERVRALALVGAFAEGASVAPAPLREALVATVRAHWGAGARVLSDVWIPGADAETRERFVRLQRAAADGAMAAELLAAVYGTDVRVQAQQIRAPTLVLHRRGDRAIPFAAGRELAALISGARLVALDGDQHPPWLGDTAALLAPLTAFLEAHDPLPRAEPPSPGAFRLPPDTPLSARETEILRLVARGLSDAEIAEALIVSPHTVHRHVANIRGKLNQPSRAAAVAHAARRGLI